MSQYVGAYRPSDLSRETTLRNASENRKLVDHLNHLDLQLHQNLVNLQAEIISLKLSRSRRKGPKTCETKTYSDPRHARDRQIHKASRVSPLSVQGKKQEISTPFLPQISPKHTALVAKSVDGVETRPNSPRRPASSRRLRELSTKSANLLPANTTSNLYRPKSSPNLSRSPAKSESNASLSDRTLQSRSSEDVSSASLELRDRVSDFLKRPNTSSGERVKKAENETKPVENNLVPTINIEDHSSEEDEGQEAISDEDDKGCYIDEVLFRNSLLVKASRDDGLSRSMPDLASLGFMDFNEVIDRRLRKSQEEIPSEAEMRKIQYLRFRDEPAPLPISSVFENLKENVHELEKIEE